jgi:hypothetical protein
LKKKQAEEHPETPASAEVFDPATLDAETSTETEAASEPWFPKKRGRKNRTPKANKDTASDLNGLLWMIHQGIASLTGVEEFALDPSESKELADAIARVQAFYPNSVLSPVAMAWTGLFVTGGKVYGTRIIAYTAKKKKKPSLVTEIPLPPGTAAASGEEN